MVAIDFIKKQPHDADSKTMKQINSTGNLNPEANKFFVIEVVRETILDFSRGTVRGFQINTQFNALNLKVV